MQWTAFLFDFFFFGSFGSLVLGFGLVEGFNGIEDGPSYPNSDIRRVHFLSHYPVLRRSCPGLQEHIFPSDRKV
jgi:hypothetical protein